MKEPCHKDLIPAGCTHRRDAKKPPKSGCIRQHMVGLHSLVAERRHSSITRYAKRSVACRDSPRHQPLRAGGTPLPHLRRLPLTSSAIHRIAPSSAIHRIAPLVAMHHRHRRKTAEERFHTLAQGWLAYPVTPGCTHIYRRRAVVEKKTDGWDSNHRSLYRYVLLCDYLLTTRRSLIRAFLPVRLRR